MGTQNGHNEPFLKSLSLKKKEDEGNNKKNKVAEIFFVFIIFFFLSREEHDVPGTSWWNWVLADGFDGQPLPDVWSSHPKHGEHSHTLWHITGSARRERGKFVFLFFLVSLLQSFIKTLIQLEMFLLLHWYHCSTPFLKILLLKHWCSFYLTRLQFLHYCGFSFTNHVNVSVIYITIDTIGNGNVALLVSLFNSFP